MKMSNVYLAKVFVFNKNVLEMPTFFVFIFKLDWLLLGLEVSLICFPVCPLWQFNYSPLMEYGKNSNITSI